MSQLQTLLKPEIWDLDLVRNICAGSQDCRAGSKYVSQLPYSGKLSSCKKWKIANLINASMITCNNAVILQMGLHKSQMRYRTSWGWGSVLHWHLSWKQETLNTESEVKTAMLNCECNSTVDYHLKYLFHPRYSISGINGLGWCT